METERKYLDPDFDALRARLVTLGASSSGAHFEDNTVFDTAAGALYADKKLLRLRRQLWPVAEKWLLTCKYPSPQSSALDGRGVKAREEAETEIADGAVMRAILTALGYGPVARYEKIREMWQLDLDGVAINVDLDILPFCRAVEIEAPPARMDRAAHALGLADCAPSLKNYHQLHQEWRMQRGLAPLADILFAEAEKMRLCAAFALPF